MFGYVIMTKVNKHIDTMIQDYYYIWLIFDNDIYNKVTKSPDSIFSTEHS